jgi:general secretion pathway protein L
MMERALNNLRLRLRDVAYRLGLPAFWRWWTGELAPLIPAVPRGALQRRRARPNIEFGDGEAIVWRPELVEGALKLTRVAVIPLAGDAAASATAGRAAVAALSKTPHGSPSSGAPRVAIALPQNQVLRKQIVLPMAVEENLLRTLAYDLDRHTPFRPDQVYFDATVIGRDLAKKTIRVDWVAALKTVVDGARRQAEEWGASVVAVVPGPSTSTPPRLNLLPEDARPHRMPWRQWQVWAPTALVASIALAVVLVPLIQKRGYAIALLQQTDAERVQAEAAGGVRRELERLQGDYNYALARKYTYPGTVQIIDDVTRVLPDDTWLTQLEMKTTVKGKETQREVFLRGESANGGKLISLLEDSKLVEQAALRSPTTKLQPGPGEVFDLGALLKVTAPPASEPLGSPSPTASAVPSAGPAATTGVATPAQPVAGAVPNTGPAPADVVAPSTPRPAASAPPMPAPVPSAVAPMVRPAPRPDPPAEPDTLFGPPPPQPARPNEVFLRIRPSGGRTLISLLEEPNPFGQAALGLPHIEGGH